MSNWIQLAGGSGYDFDEAKLFGPWGMMIGLAHPLAGLNRYGRHQDRDWSVAAHSVAVARTIERMAGAKDPASSHDAGAAGLLHDAHEAVIGDIMTPVAWAIDYDRTKAVKEEVQHAIHLALAVPHIKRPENWKYEVKQADAAALHVERQIMLAPSPREWNVPVPDHKWMNAMYEEVNTLLQRGQAFGTPAADVFIYEYARLVNKATL